MSRVDHSSIDGDEAKSNDAEEAMGFVAAEKRTEWFSRGLCPHKDISAVTDWINQITNETAKNWLSHVTLALTQTIAAYKKKHPLMTEFGVTNAFASGKTSLATKRSVVAKTPKRPKPTQEKRQIELQAGSAASTDTDETKESTSTPTPENPRPKNPRDVTYAFDDDLALTYIAAIRCLYFLKAQEKALVSSSHTFNS